MTWLVGGALLSLYLLVRHMRIHRMTQQASPVTDPRILDLLARCQRQVGTQMSGLESLQTCPLGHCPSEPHREVQ